MKRPPRRIARVMLVLSITAAAMAATFLIFARWSGAAGALEAARTAERIRPQIQGAADAHVDSLSGLAETLGDLPPGTDEDFRIMAARSLARGPALIGVNRADDRFRLRNFFPEASNTAVKGLDLKTRFDALPAALRAAQSRAPAATNVLPLAQGGEGLQLYTPVLRQDRWDGLVEGVLRHGNFLSRELTPEAGRFRVAVLEEETAKTIYPADGAALWENPSDRDYFFRLRWADKSWWILLHPGGPKNGTSILIAALVLETLLGAAGLVWAVRSPA